MPNIYNTNIFWTKCLLLFGCCVLISSSSGDRKSFLTKTVIFQKNLFFNKQHWYRLFNTIFLSWKNKNFNKLLTCIPTLPCIVIIYNDIGKGQFIIRFCQPFIVSGFFYSLHGLKRSHTITRSFIHSVFIYTFLIKRHFNFALIRYVGQDIQKNYCSHFLDKEKVVYNFRLIYLPYIPPLFLYTIKCH